MAQSDAGFAAAADADAGDVEFFAGRRGAAAFAALAQDVAGHDGERRRHRRAAEKLPPPEFAFVVLHVCPFQLFGVDRFSVSVFGIA